VSFARIDPTRAREIFIEGALVAGEFESPHPFWAHNRGLIREIEELEHRARRPDVLVDERVLFEFYDKRIPKDVRDPRTFDTWYRKAVEKDPKLLELARGDLMRHGAESVTEELFPRTLEMGGMTFPLAYRFDPGHALDGVTINVPLALLNQVDEAAIDWLVPGMIREKAAWTMKALPKRIRTQLVPVPEHVTQFLERTSVGEKNVGDAVLDYASRISGERLDADIWSRDEAPPHLRMNIRVVDDAKRELAMGRDLGDLRKRLGEAATVTLAKAKPGMEREGITSWDFGDLPETVSFRRGNQSMTGYLALSPAPDAKSVAMRMYDTPDRARAEHREGVKVLMSLEMKEQLRALERGMSDLNPIALKFQATIPADKLKADLLAAVIDRAFIGEDDPPRTAKAFEEQRKRAKARLPAVTQGATRYLAAIVEASQQYAQVVAQSGALGRVVQDVKAARDRLVYPGFVARTPWERLEHLPRYLKGYALRLQKYRAGAERDQKHAGTVTTLWNNYEARVRADRDAGRIDPKLEEFRWLIEELRISLFAQELRTPFPVSGKRLQKFWDENLR
jgi:ATP-dependent helicase HrpA